MPKNTPNDIISRVLDLQEVDTFQWDDAPVMFTFPVDFSRVLVTWAIPLPVYGGDAKLIGFGSLGVSNLYPKQGPEYADLFLVKDSPERFDLQMNTRPMYLVADNVTRIYHDTDGEAVLKEIRIDSLKITDVLEGIAGAGVEAIR